MMLVAVMTYILELTSSGNKFETDIDGISEALLFEEYKREDCQN